MHYCKRVKRKPYNFQFLKELKYYPFIFGPQFVEPYSNLESAGFVHPETETLAHSNLQTLSSSIRLHREYLFD